MKRSLSACLCFCFPVMFFLAMTYPADFALAADESQRGFTVNVNQASIVRIGTDYRVEEDEVVEGDIVVVGGGLTVEGTIIGNAVVVGGSIYLASTAQVDGDVVVIGGLLEREEGAVVKGQVSEQPYLDLGETVEPEAGEEQEAKVVQKKDIVRFGTTIHIAADEVVEGDVVSIGGDIIVEGEVRGDVVATRGDIKLLPTARVTGDVVSTFGEVEMEEGSKVDGDVVQVSMSGIYKVIKKEVHKGRRYRFSLHRPEAQSVALTGDFVDWIEDGIAMEKDEEGTWSTLITLSPGTHYYKFIVDGVAIADPDNPDTAEVEGHGVCSVVVVKPLYKTTEVREKHTYTKVHKTKFSPGIDFNRVDGFCIGFILENKYMDFPMPRFSIDVVHSKKRRRWMYLCEVEQPLIPSSSLSIGASVYDRTDTYDKEIITDIENLLSAALLKEDYRDYFDRRGVTGFLAIRPFENHSFRFSYLSDDYRPLYKLARSAIFRKNKIFDPNPHRGRNICEDDTCDKVRIEAARFEYEYDSRDNEKTPHLGTLIRLEGEWARQSFGSDYTYNRYVADLRRYSRISPGQNIALRVKVGITDLGSDYHASDVPPLYLFFPKEFYVGGIGTMPGYWYKEFRGTQMALANLEYWISAKGNVYVLFFSDAGDARGRDENWRDAWDALKIKFDAGFGLRYETTEGTTLTLKVAKRLDDMEKPLVLTLRGSRMF